MPRVPKVSDIETSALDPALRNPAQIDPGPSRALGRAGMQLGEAVGALFEAFGEVGGRIDKTNEAMAEGNARLDIIKGVDAISLDINANASEDGALHATFPERASKLDSEVKTKYPSAYNKPSFNLWKEGYLYDRGIGHAKAQTTSQANLFNKEFEAQSNDLISGIAQGSVDDASAVEQAAALEHKLQGMQNTVITEREKQEKIDALRGSMDQARYNSLEPTAKEAFWGEVGKLKEQLDQEGQKGSPSGASSDRRSDLIAPGSEPQAGQVGSPSGPSAQSRQRADLNIIDRIGQAPGRPRGVAPSAVVIHHTSDRSLEGALSWSQKSKTGANYYIDRDGSVVRWAPDTHRITHIRDPGSKYRTDSNGTISNTTAIGIEVVARNDKDVTPEQRASLNALLGSLSQSYKIDPRNIVGHGEIQGGAGGNREADEGVLAAREFRASIGRAVAETSGRPVELAGISKLGGPKGVEVADASGALPQAIVEELKSADPDTLIKDVVAPDAFEAIKAQIGEEAETATVGDVAHMVDAESYLKEGAEMAEGLRASPEQTTPQIQQGGYSPESTYVPRALAPGQKVRIKDRGQVREFLSDNINRWPLKVQKELARQAKEQALIAQREAEVRADTMTKAAEADMEANGKVPEDYDQGAVARAWRKNPKLIAQHNHRMEVARQSYQVRSEFADLPDDIIDQRLEQLQPEDTNSEDFLTRNDAHKRLVTSADKLKRMREKDPGLAVQNSREVLAIYKALGNSAPTSAAEKYALIAARVHAQERLGLEIAPVTASEAATWSRRLKAASAEEFSDVLPAIYKDIKKDGGGRYSGVILNQVIAQHIKSKEDRDIMGGILRDLAEQGEVLPGTIERMREKTAIRKLSQSLAPSNNPSEPAQKPFSRSITELPVGRSAQPYRVFEPQLSRTPLPQKNPMRTVPQKAIEILRANPDRAAQFEETFKLPPGSAAKFMLK